MRELKEKWIKEFISKGAEVEHNGQKVRPNTTTSIVIGKVSRLDEAGTGNLKATVKVTGAKYDFNGFVNDNTPVSNLLKQAKDEDLSIAVRLERKRKKGVDPTKDITELTKTPEIARDNIVWIVAGVYNFGNGDWILSDGAVSNPEEDPGYVAQELKSASYSTAGFFQSDAPKLTTTDRDWKISHLVSMFTYASEHNLDNEIGLGAPQLKVLASYMLKAVDQVQMKTRNISAPNYNDYSHTKARGMLFSWMRVNPLSKEIMTAKGGFNEWITRFINESVELWSWAGQEVDKEG